MQPKAYSYIRFSSPEQESGDSLRRQIKLSEEYAKKHNLILDNSTRLTDKGLSAFHGDHRTKGYLGQFLSLVQAGQIPEGSVLICESLDRLSRQEVLESLELFLSIIRSGIRLVTLADGMTYDKEGISQNWTQLIISLTVMSRAHEESLLKSGRISAAWAEKRKKAAEDGVKLTKIAPAWLVLSQDRTEFTVKPGAKVAINKIFDMRLSGWGKTRTARRLNSDPGTWKPSENIGWQESYIQKVLANRAVLGEFQPHSKDGQALGNPILGYFPEIVDKEKFDRVQEISRRNSERPGRGGGRHGKFKNLFRHLVKCSTCGAPMAFSDKGAGRSYFICDRTRQGMPGCKSEYIRYDLSEQLLLQYCKGLDVSEILPGNLERQSELSTFQGNLQSLDGELFQLERKIDNALDSLLDLDEDRKELRQALQDRADKMLTRKAELEERKKEVQSKIEVLSNSGQDAKEQLQSIQELLTYLDKAEGQERIDTRANLQAQLRRLIKKINVNPTQGTFAIFFSTGERRLLSLEKGLILDANPQRAN